MTMDLNRAQEIVSAINDRAFFNMGLKDTVASLGGISLAEMLEAKSVVEADNDERQRRQQMEGGAVRFRVVPDDRLIAAAYALEHYYPDNGAVVAMPFVEWPHDRRALAVVGLEPARGGAGDE